MITDTQITTPAPARNGKRFRVYYGTQVSIQPPTFVLSCNDPPVSYTHLNINVTNADVTKHIDQEVSNE